MHYYVHYKKTFINLADNSPQKKNYKEISRLIYNFYFKINLVGSVSASGRAETFKPHIVYYINPF